MGNFDDLDDGIEQWNDFDITLASGLVHSYSVLQGRDSIQVNIEHGKVLVTLRNGDGSVREKQIVDINGALVIERTRKQKKSAVPPPSNGPSKVVTIGGQSIN